MRETTKLRLQRST